MEDDAWNALYNSLDPLYETLITDCYNTIYTKNKPNYPIFSKLFQNDFSEIPQPELDSLDCVDEVERFMVKKFKPEYSSLFNCKYKCNIADPHGLIASVIVFFLIKKVEKKKMLSILPDDFQ